MCEVHCRDASRGTEMPCSSQTPGIQEGRIINGVENELEKFMKDNTLSGIIWMQVVAPSLHFWLLGAERTEESSLCIQFHILSKLFANLLYYISIKYERLESNPRIKTHFIWNMEFTDHDPTALLGLFCHLPFLRLGAHQAVWAALRLNEQHGAVGCNLRIQRGSAAAAVGMQATYIPHFFLWQKGKWRSSLPHTRKYKAGDYSYYNHLLFETKFKGLSSLINLPAD